MTDKKRVKYLILLIILFIIWLLVFGCEKGTPPPSPKFKTGDYVVHNLSGIKGQILKEYHGDWSSTGRAYKVRLYTPQILTDTKLLTKDKPVKFETLSIKVLYEFEMSLYTPEE